MLKKSQRISKNLISGLKRGRLSANSAHFALQFAPLEEEVSRCAVSVSKKISKSAVIRNGIRRRVYTALRPKISNLKYGLYLFIAKKGVDRIHGEVLAKELNLLLKAFERS